MKLDAGNPNLKKRSHRSEAVYVHQPRDPSVVPAPALNIWKQPVYTLPKFETPRPGANNFLAVKSRGF